MHPDIAYGMPASSRRARFTVPLSRRATHFGRRRVVSLRLPFSDLSTEASMADFGSSRSIVDRMRGAAALDVATYEEVEADVNATGQAAIVVVLVAIASGI